ncbi:Gp49 family protein [Acinetobacter sp. CFCC 10889]|uniref:Gp49 family protein n=1 Tax=Acinetobacter sp. CFCC 10889 TaxID=1775557 RepID=UPI000DD04423|nr:Gp49 family protein [Acinetobacter sp. CFCC 10889]
MTDLNKLNEFIKDKRVESNESTHGETLFQVTIELSDRAEVVGFKNENFEEAEKDALKRAYEYAEKNGFFGNVVQAEQKLNDSAVTVRVTADQIDSKIKSVEYILPRDVCKRDNGVEVFDAPLALQTLTFCIITLENGFTVTGESACVDPANFDADVGRRIAFHNAREKIWQLEGYLLKEQLYMANERLAFVDSLDFSLAMDVGKCTEPSPENTEACAVGEACLGTADGYNDYQKLDMKLMKGRFLVDVLANAGTDRNLTTAASTKLQSLIKEL